MALTKCPDCSREISDQAPQCIGCGRPMSVSKVAEEVWRAPSIRGCPKCGMLVKERSFREGNGSGLGTVLLIVGALLFFVHWIAGLVLVCLGALLFTIPGVVVRAEDCTGPHCMYSRRLGRE